jgi:hypothetical protein
MPQKAPGKKDQPRNPHRWTAIALGRICASCGLVQATGEFDDSLECPRNK